MGALQTKYLRQDANSYLFNTSGAAQALTADAASTEFDFDVAGGCPKMKAFLKVSNRATGESVTFKVQESEDGSSWSDTGHQLVVAADGEYIINLDNDIIQEQHGRIYADVTLPSGGAISVLGYLVAGQP